ncbi:MAG: CHASE2 domain-containing protein [Hyphomicrobiaceae bacterium]|nr:CHASE2 domain-containing protein [Hyphomicrobiaceae bacterium]
MAAAFLPRLPADWSTRILAPGWMPHQIVQLLEYSNDVQVAVLADRLAGPHPRVAIVLITDETLAELPYISPIDRGLLARVVKAVDGLGARAIGLDILFDQATEPDKDAALIERFRLSRAALVLGGADERTPLAPRRRSWQTSFMQRAGLPFGYLNLRYDVREAALTHVVRSRASAAPNSAFKKSFAELLAERAGIRSVPESRRIAWLRPPLSGGETFTTVDADAVLAADREPDGILARALEAQLDGRIVLIGGDIDGRDRHPTPLSLVDGQDTLGIAIHAQILAGLMDGRSLSDLTPAGVSFLAGVATLLGALIGWFAARRRLVFTLAIGVGTLIVMGVSAIVLWQFRSIVPVALLIASLVGAAVVMRLARSWLAQG